MIPRPRLSKSPLLPYWYCGVPRDLYVFAETAELAYRKWLNAYLVRLAVK